ncbi:MAG: HslU--HslV peptidase ATPase subunit, partial [Acidobacteria bacterium]
MVIYLAGETEEQEVRLDEMTPRQIVVELDKHVVGQKAAKRAVAIALRNRVRRKKLPPDLAADVIPKNIIMIGSTGVGKTEIARRLARMSNSPFLKVEASKFTEVGYVGRDVESMIRDLTEISVDMVRQEKIEEIADKAELNVEERILDILLPPPKPSGPSPLFDFDSGETSVPMLVPENEPRDENFARTREKLRTQLRSGKLDNRLVEVEVREKSFPTIEFAGPMG